MKRLARMAVPTTQYVPPTSAAKSYTGRLVTPLYGGGVKAGVVDTALPIRPSAIRGQLRFWWRVACGPFADSKAMFAREVAMWGGIGSNMPTASKVRVRVQAQPIGDNDVRPKSALGVPPYAMILDPGADPKLLRTGHEFTLALSAADLTPEQHEELHTALRWWASFGGLGARSRRGLGALQITDLTPVTEREVTACGGWLVLGKPKADERDAWQWAVGRLQRFRQGVNVGRNPGQTPNRPGRSRWPEADALRVLAKRHAPRHAPEHPAGTVFPRAAFGLPIVFHFQGNELPDHTLEPAGDNDRMASPLILRPYWDGKQWYPAALLLPGWEVALTQKLKFKGQATQPQPWPNTKAEEQRLAALTKPIKDQQEHDPLSAFMQFFAGAA